MTIANGVKSRLNKMATEVVKRNECVGHVIYSVECIYIHLYSPEATA